MDKNLVIIIVLVALVIVSGVQAFEIAQIKDSYKIGTVGQQNVQQNTNNDYSQQSAPLSNAMVGGC